MRIDGCDHTERTSLSRVAMVHGREVEIPEGWKIAKGCVMDGDRYLNRILFLHDNLTVWEEIPNAFELSEIYQNTQVYALIIRRIEDA